MLKAHDKIIGHAVTRHHLYAGVADLCLEEEDPEPMEVLWKLAQPGDAEAVYNRRMRRAL